MLLLGASAIRPMRRPVAVAVAAGVVRTVRRHRPLLKSVARSGLSQVSDWMLLLNHDRPSRARTMPLWLRPLDAGRQVVGAVVERHRQFVGVVEGERRAQGWWPVFFVDAEASSSTSDASRLYSRVCRAEAHACRGAAAGRDGGRRGLRRSTAVAARCAGGADWRARHADGGLVLHCRAAARPSSVADAVAGLVHGVRVIVAVVQRNRVHTNADASACRCCSRPP